VTFIIKKLLIDKQNKNACAGSIKILKNPGNNNPKYIKILVLHLSFEMFFKTRYFGGFFI
jgi:hypothetical protein